MGDLKKRMRASPCTFRPQNLLNQVIPVLLPIWQGTISTAAPSQHLGRSSPPMLQARTQGSVLHASVLHSPTDSSA